MYFGLNSIDDVSSGFLTHLLTPRASRQESDHMAELPKAANYDANNLVTPLLKAVPTYVLRSVDLGQRARLGSNILSPSWDTAGLGYSAEALPSLQCGTECQHGLTSESQSEGALFLHATK